MHCFHLQALIILYLLIINTCHADILVEESAPDFDEIYDVHKDRPFQHQENIQSDKFHISGQLGDTLQQSKGIQIYQSGGIGKQTSFFLRGGRSGDQGLFLNGVLIQDPLDINRGVDIGGFSSDLFDEIEIYQGSHNPLYSDNTLSGAINLITNWNSHDHLKLTLAEKNTRGLMGQIKKGHFLFKASNIFSDNISSANEMTNNFAESDSFERNSFYIEYRNKFKNRIKVKTFYFSQSVYNEIDQTDLSTNLPVDKLTNDISQQKINVFSSQFNFRKNRTNQFDLILNLKESDRLSGEQKFKGNIPEAIIRYHLFPSEKQVISINLKAQREKAIKGSLIGSRELQQYLSSVIYHFEDQKLKCQASLSSLKYEGYDQIFQYQLNALYRQNKVYKIQYMLSRNVKFPSLYQLFAPESLGAPIGNINLRPEKVKGHDFNFSLGKFFLLNLFYQKYSNLIDYNFSTGYQNNNSAKIYGLSPQLTIQNNVFKSYSGIHILRTEANKERTYLDRRPRISAMQTFDFHLPKNIFINYQIEYVGERNDSGRMPSYQLHHFLFKKAFKRKKQNIQIKVVNLLNKKYEQIRGYGTFGRTLWFSAQTIF